MKKINFKTIFKIILNLVIVSSSAFVGYNIMSTYNENLDKTAVVLDKIKTDMQDSANEIDSLLENNNVDNIETVFNNQVKFIDSLYESMKHVTNINNYSPENHLKFREYMNEYKEYFEIVPSSKLKKKDKEYLKSYKNKLLLCVGHLDTMTNDIKSKEKFDIKVLLSTKNRFRCVQTTFKS